MGTWSLWWIVVRSDLQGQGVGPGCWSSPRPTPASAGPACSSSRRPALPHYEPTRRFYLKHGYDEEARLRDYYAPGDDQVVFRKAL